jgi:hypothetical protein
MDYFAGQLEPENKEPGKIGGNNPIDGGDYPDVGISFYKPFLTFTK